MAPIIPDKQLVEAPPATKVPSLDTADHHLASFAEHVKGLALVTDIPSCIDGSNEKVLIKTYGRFVSGLTGAEEVAFILVRDSGPDPSLASMVVVSAVIHWSTEHEDEALSVSWDELDMSCCHENEIQFALDLRKSNSGDNFVLERQDLFVLCIGPSAVANKAVANISYPSQHIPEPAAAQLLKIFISQIASGVESLHETGPVLSLVNHPPVLEPPVQFSSNWDIATSATHLHAGFKHWASAAPNSPALDFFSSLSTEVNPTRHQVLSYGMLNSAANHVASLLLKLVSHDTIAAGRCIVPVYMSTSPELYISYLAILKGGLAFSPLPMDAPLERIREIIQDIMPPVVLGIGGKPDEWASQGIQTTWIDVTEISRWKTLSNQDMSGEDSESSFQPLTIANRTINEAQATIMMTTPSLAALLRPSHLQTLRSLWCMGEKPNRTVIDNFGMRSPDTSYTLANLYGPTEAAINCTVLAPVEYLVRGSIIGETIPTCSLFVLDHKSQVPKVIPTGFVGELAIGGSQVSEGYMHRPEETAKAYVSSAEYGRLYRTGDMARIVWDKSGRQLIEFLGRISLDQVKLSGRRVELGEIESVLSTVPGVIELVAAITKVSDAREGSEQIVACIVANTQSSDERKRLVDTCCHNSDKFLPAYMRPLRYILLDSLRRSSSGKVDRKKVHSEILASGIDQSFSSSSETHCLPTTMDELDPHCDSLQSSTQTLLMVAIGEAVGEPSSAISPETPLASVRLDSLGAVRLLQKLRDHSINGLEVGDVLQCGTMKGLIAKVALASQPRNLDSKSVVYEPQLHKVLGSFAERNLSSCAERLGVREDQIQTVLPPTATQSGMLASFLRSSNKTIGSNPAYVYHSVMPIRDGIDIRELKQAWDTVMSSYDSFGTVSCHLEDDMSPFAQCILKPRDEFVKPAWSTYSVGLGHRDYNATVERACRNAETQIDIGTNASHISLVSSETQSTVVLSMFHGIFDGGSLQILLQDVTEAYAGKPVRERTSLEHIVHDHYSADPEATARF
ncbi:hypothetical protein V3481_006592 [Fusarium oxysporum f. sp. vasinfectum]